MLVMERGRAKCRFFYLQNSLKQLMRPNHSTRGSLLSYNIIFIAWSIMLLLWPSTQRTRELRPCLLAVLCVSFALACLFVACVFACLLVACVFAGCLACWFVGWLLAYLLAMRARLPALCACVACLLCVNVPQL